MVGWSRKEPKVVGQFTSNISLIDNASLTVILTKDIETLASAAKPWRY